MEGASIATEHATSDGQWLRVTVPDADTFEAVREALGDPVWLVGATWDLLTTNDYKRGRFEDAFGAWLERQDADTASNLLRGAGARVDVMPTPN